jgi:hypothetical protein
LASDLRDLHGAGRLRRDPFSGRTRQERLQAAVDLSSTPFVLDPSRQVAVHLHRLRQASPSPPLRHPVPQPPRARSRSPSKATPAPHRPNLCTHRSPVRPRVLCAGAVASLPIETIGSTDTESVIDGTLYSEDVSRVPFPESMSARIAASIARRPVAHTPPPLCTHAVPVLSASCCAPQVCSCIQACVSTGGNNFPGRHPRCCADTCLPGACGVLGLDTGLHTCAQRPAVHSSVPPAQPPPRHVHADGATVVAVKDFFTPLPSPHAVPVRYPDEPLAFRSTIQPPDFPPSSQDAVVEAPPRPHHEERPADTPDRDGETSRPPMRRQRAQRVPEDPAPQRPPPTIPDARSDRSSDYSAAHEPKPPAPRSTAARDTERPIPTDWWRETDLKGGDTQGSGFFDDWFDDCSIM